MPKAPTRERTGRKVGPKEAALAAQRDPGHGLPEGHGVDQDGTLLPRSEVDLDIQLAVNATDSPTTFQGSQEEAVAEAHEALAKIQADAFLATVSAGATTLEQIDAAHDQDNGEHASDGGTLLITDADESYDLTAYTKAIELLPFKSNLGRFRSVRIHPEYAAEQTMRYATGLFVALQPDEFSERIELNLVDPVQQGEATLEQLQAERGEPTTGEQLEAEGAADEAKASVPGASQRMVLASPVPGQPSKTRAVNHLVCGAIQGMYAAAACGIAGRILGDPATPAVTSTKAVQTAVMCESEACGGTEPVKAQAERKGKRTGRPKPQRDETPAEAPKRGRRKAAAADAGTPPPPPDEGKGKPEGEGDKSEQPANPRADALNLINQLLAAGQGGIGTIDLEAELANLKAAIEAIPEPSARGNRRSAAAGEGTSRRVVRTDLPADAPETAPDRVRADGTKPTKLLRATAEGPFLIGGQVKKGKYMTVVRDTRDDTDREYAKVADARAELTELVADLPQEAYNALHAASVARLGKDGTGR